MKTKYDKIGGNYNSTRQADPYLKDRLFYHLQPTSQGLYLDIGCGTGNYTIALSNRGFKFMGVDPSEKMLQVARLRKEKMDWQIGSAEQIPAEDKLFDGAIGTLTIHHWADLKKGFQEVDRVLKEESRFVLFTSTPEQMAGYWLNHYFPSVFETSNKEMPSISDIKLAIEKCNLCIIETEKYFIKDDLEDHFLYCGKNKPEYYFDENIRRGISTFSTSSNFEEVNKGLAELRKDIDNDSFESVKKQYENDLGDYLFIIFEKTK